ncbi:hypothetical protein At15955_49210 (plasmid) [Agrobacterium tumefaciens]|nr:hypothetical protein At15955_49210 [Agrobacterium tumefaciens]AYM71209.1 hypothetical protein AtA6_49930 [Agrobacterium tumefaciens]CUX06225.1 hypothetical protein AGR1C_pAt40308 [Agrobacterium fabacearum TT111]
MRGLNVVEQTTDCLLPTARRVAWNPADRFVETAVHLRCERWPHAVQHWVAVKSVGNQWLVCDIGYSFIIDKSIGILNKPDVN